MSDCDGKCDRLSCNQRWERAWECHRCAIQVYFQRIMRRHLFEHMGPYLLHRASLRQRPGQTSNGLMLCYITLLLIYVLFKIGIFQCITKSLCKMCWAAFKGYWCALFHVARFLCYKIKNTKRVSRKHRNIHHVSDLEKGHKSSSSSDSDYAHTYRHQTINRKRKSFQRELNVRQKRRNSHRHIRLRKADVSFRGKDRSRRRSMRRRTKRLQVRNLEIGRTKETSIKRRRL
ncbi:unnamed protein product [Rhodiola kirilowii]